MLYTAVNSFAEKCSIGNIFIVIIITQLAGGIKDEQGFRNGFVPSVPVALPS